MFITCAGQPLHAHTASVLLHVAWVSQSQIMPKDTNKNNTPWDRTNEQKNELQYQEGMSYYFMYTSAQYLLYKR
jgi:hypothetical protein